MCGKDATTASLQDSLLHVIKGISTYAYHASVNGKSLYDIDRFVLEKSFATLTNVNFDP